MHFAVLDVETTGFDANGADRIVEIAVLRVDEYGRPMGDYSTLVNPHRNTGAPHIHGIHNSDVVSAPTFKQVAGDVVELLRDAILVAHNASFDMRFLTAELRRAGVKVRNPAVLCTLQLARQLVPEARNKKLGTLCTHFGIRPDGAHSAYADTAATVQLLFHLLGRLGDWRLLTPQQLGVTGQLRDASKWPKVQPSGLAVTREQVSYTSPESPSPIPAMIMSLPVVDNPYAEVDRYQGLLGKAMLDRQIHGEDVHALYSLALELGLSQTQIHQEHRRFVWDLALNAMRDGVISGAERRDLENVGKLLGLAFDDYEGIVANASSTNPQLLPPPQASNTVFDFSGKTVCFSGTLRCRVPGTMDTKEMAESHAVRLGAKIQKRLSKNLDVLVVTDPNATSNTISKAREYGVTIIAEPAFWGLVGVQLE